MAAHPAPSKPHGRCPSPHWDFFKLPTCCQTSQAATPSISLLPLSDIHAAVYLQCLTTLGMCGKVLFRAPVRPPIKNSWLMVPLGHTTSKIPERMGVGVPGMSMLLGLYNVGSFGGPLS